MIPSWWTKLIQPHVDAFGRGKCCSGRVGDSGKPPSKKPEPPPMPARMLSQDDIEALSAIVESRRGEPTKPWEVVRDAVQRDKLKWTKPEPPQLHSEATIKAAEMCRRRAEAIRFSDWFCKMTQYSEGAAPGLHLSMSDRIKAYTPEHELMPQIRGVIGKCEIPPGSPTLAELMCKIADSLKEMKLDAVQSQSSLFRAFQDQCEFETELKTALGLTDNDCHDGYADCTNEKIIEAIRELKGK